MEEFSPLNLLLMDPEEIGCSVDLQRSYFERVVGRLGERRGSFVIQHGGLMGPALAPRTFGHVVPGSGTGELAGLVGDLEINRRKDGTHTLTLNYDLETKVA